MKIILVAGGTGGHIFPAMATACEIREKRPETEIIWITTNRANEKEIAERFSVKMLSLNVDGIERKISLQPIKAIVKLVKSVVFMKKYLKKEKPDTVIAFGGYVCAPVLFAAKSNKIPFYIQEQNTVAGAVNKFFAKDAKKMFLGMPLIDSKFRTPHSALLTGTPIRKIEDYSNFEYPSSVDKKRRTILICGGSQGAMSMNTVLVKAVKWFSQNNFQVIWQTGVTGESEIKKEFEGDENLIIYSSFTDLYPYYSIAELLIGRAGAGTISEALLFSLPSIFIPLPWSAENHQWYNAGYAQDSGWALRLEQNENVSDKITEFMENCEKNIEIFEKMKNCASQSCENAAKIIAEAVL